MDTNSVMDIQWWLTSSDSNCFVSPITVSVAVQVHCQTSVRLSKGLASRHLSYLGVISFTRNIFILPSTYLFIPVTGSGTALWSSGVWTLVHHVDVVLEFCRTWGREVTWCHTQPCTCRDNWSWQLVCCVYVYFNELLPSIEYETIISNSVSLPVEKTMNS